MFVARLSLKGHLSPQPTLRTCASSERDAIIGCRMQLQHFLGCVTRPRAQRRVTQPRKSLLADLCTLTNLWSGWRWLKPSYFNHEFRVFVNGISPVVVLQNVHSRIKHLFTHNINEAAVWSVIAVPCCPAIPFPSFRIRGRGRNRSFRP